MRTFIAVIVALGIFSCEQRGFEMNKVKLITKDAEKLAEWYTTNLEFEPSNDNTLLYHKNLTILIEEDDKYEHRDTIRQNYGLIEVPGFFKIGFLTNQFDGLIKELKNNSIKIEGSIFKDEKLDKRSVVLKDPDGNRIQIFEDNGNDKLKPYFFSLIVENVGEQEKWYQMKFPILETHNLDQPENDLYVRILEGNDFAIELINVSTRQVIKELDYEEITGIYSVEIDGAKATFDRDHEGHKITSP